MNLFVQETIRFIYHAVVLFFFLLKYQKIFKPGNIVEAVYTKLADIPEHRILHTESAPWKTYSAINPPVRNGHFMLFYFRFSSSMVSLRCVCCACFYYVFV